MTQPVDTQREMDALQAAMATLQSQRALLGAAVVDAAVAGLQAQWLSLIHI